MYKIVLSLGVQKVDTKFNKNKEIFKSLSNYSHFSLWLQGNAHGIVISLKYVNLFENGKE